MFENRSKCRTLYFPILEFSTHFCPIKKVIYLGFAFSKTRPIETI